MFARRLLVSPVVNRAGLRSARSCASGPLILSDEEQQFANVIRDFSQSKIAPRVRQSDDDAIMAPELITDLFTQGLMGIETPGKYDGADMGFFGSIIAIEEIAKVDAAVGVLVDVQNTLVNNIFFRFANEEQRLKYLPKLATDTVGCFCLSEASSGSDAFALKTKATKDGDDYIINGSKMWITNSGEAGLFLVMANVDPSQGYKGITCFVVEGDNAGVSVGKRENKLGIRASSTCEVTFTDCRVPSSAIVGELGKGYQIAIQTLNEGRIGIAAQMLGIAQGAFDLGVKYSFERKQFGQFIGDFQGMQHQQAQIAVEIAAARLLTYNAARLKEAGKPFIKEAAMCKLYASQIAEKSASKAIEWLGGVGFIKEYLVEKYYRDAKIGAIYEGTSNIQLQTIAKLIKTETLQQ
eukprot:TRINITY_DN68231_c0_g1_i1.p1 TRINITY_DN68231_c0_g1~~TRINITY_DN68231_c0_g1_i1.p1  ORF type:complete len:409 (-),score=62.76 TRINITY_DN68231_c0_g1_i1:474-1700(-)